jgi:hypothetical protein
MVMRHAKHVARMGQMRDAHKMPVAKPEGDHLRRHPSSKGNSGKSAHLLYFFRHLGRCS